MDDESHQWSDLRVVGTPGYIDTEYIWHQQLTTKSDVYIFGVVLLEMLSGYKAIHKNENGLPRNVVDFLEPYIAQDEIHKVLDPRVPSPTPFERKAVAHVGSLAMAFVSLKGFFGNNSDPGSLIDSEGRSESLIESVSIPSLFLANKSDTDGSSESNEISPIFTHYPNSIVSFFSPARSSSVSENHYEIIFPNPSIPTNGPTSLSISLLFPPTMSETETYGSSSESNETQFSYSIMSFFPPARSQSDISKNFTMISTDPSISASPIHTTETATFLKYLTLQVLLEATNNFSEDHKIRTSSFGSAYRSTLDDGREVAIKRAEISMSKPYVSKHYSDNAFLNELKALSLLNHKNLVCLLGFYEDSNERILVYDNMKNGTLHNHLHKLQSIPLISWTAGIKVALDVASGIEYLHNVVPPIIHRDIKSSNILLDATWTAKVSDFSLSVKAPVDIESYQWSDLVGTIGYIDPEYIWHQHLTTKSDVYSFGIILLEMLSRYKALHKDENGMCWHIVDFVVPYIAKNEIHKVLDPKVPPPTLFEKEALAYVGSLAEDCVSKEGRNWYEEAYNDQDCKRPTKSLRGVCGCGW
nr:receptor-like cytoplasmic kinase 176 [Quercus suber]